MPQSENLEVTVIAHSFGARAATMAICVGPALMRSNQPVSGKGVRGSVNRFIGLAPGFSLSRFADTDRLFYENIYYRDYCEAIEHLVFTASSNDSAFAPVFWSDSAGDYDEMKKYCEREQPVSVACTVASSDGGIDGYDASVKLNYIDTSELMKFAMPGTKGSGHSDIFRPEIGQLLWTLINRLAER
jgi:hypothetical protein